VIDLNATVRNAEHQLRHSLGDDIELECVTGEDQCLVRADVGELELMLTNLAFNARDAMPYGGHISVTVGLDSLENNDAVVRRFGRVDVRDNGEGMTPEVAARAFEPFFTTKETGRGTGLGLAMVYGIATRSGGSASIASNSGEGATVSVLFPLSEAPSEVELDDQYAATSEKLPVPR